MRIVNKIRRLRFGMVWGTPRRLFLSVFRPNYVRKMLASRRGTCRRCGVCCRLVWRCRFCYEDNDIPSCKLYGFFRFPNCIHFPIDQRDLADRDRVSPYTTCGFWWVREEHSRKPAMTRPGTGRPAMDECKTSETTAPPPENARQ